MGNFFEIFHFSELNILLALTGVCLTIFTMSAVHSHIELKRKEYYLITFFYIISFLVVVFTGNWMVFYIDWEFITGSILTSLYSLRFLYLGIIKDLLRSRKSRTGSIPVYIYWII